MHIDYIAQIDSSAASGNIPATSYYRFVTVRVANVASIALIDSGNSWRNVISVDFAKLLGIDLDHDLQPLANSKPVGTADKHNSLDVVGETKQNLHILFGDHPTRFKFKPVVVRGLAMNINICGPFLKRHHIDQLHSQNALSINGRLIPLFDHFKDPATLETIESDIVLRQDCTVPPRSVSQPFLTITDMEQGYMPASPGMIVGSIDFMAKTDCHPWLNAMATPQPSGRIVAGIMNTTDSPIFIPSGTKYGTFKLACSADEHSQYPWRIATISAPERKPTATEIFSKSNAAHHSAAILPTSVEQPLFMKGPTTQTNKSQRLAFIQDTFALRNNSLLSTDMDRTKAASLLLNYWSVFSFDGSFGATNLLEHTIYTEPGPPINQRYRPINPSLETHLKKQIDEWLKHDVIEKSNSPYNFGLVCVPKKNGKYRWCVDYRDLNKISKRDTFPIGNIEDNLARLSNSTIFSGLDGSGAFHVIPLEKKSKEKTAFATPFGLYQFKRLPFGLANGPATYARLIKMVLSEIPTNVAIPYLDDTIIHSPNLTQHFRDLALVLDAHDKAGLKLQPAKCQLFQKEINYLGHKVSQHGIAPLAEHTDLIKKWPLPTNRNEVRSFLGKIGYYRRFIQNFAGLAKPLTNKLAKDGSTDKQTFTPTDEFTKAFNTLRKSLLVAPILAYPQFSSSSPFILDTDWSYDNAAIGAVLMQKQNGLERVIAFGGHKLSKAQQNYGPTKGELFAVIYFVNHYRYYLAHRHFIVRTDHQSLKYVETMMPPKGMIERWLSTLANYSFTVEHRAGKKHQNADALSRAPHLTNDYSLQCDELVASIATTVSQTWSPTYLRKQQQEDKDISFLHPFITKKQPIPKETFLSLSQTGRVYANLLPSLIVDRHNIIRYLLPQSHNPFSSNRYVYLLPNHLVREAIMRAHKQISHLASKATFNKLKLYAYFPNMMRRIHQTLMTCGPCQTKTTRLPDQHHTLKSRRPGFPFQTLSMDFVGPFPPSHPRKNVYLLTIKDLFTKWLEAFPLKVATASEVARIFTEEIFPRFGKCEQIHSDQGTQFTSNLMKDLGQILNIKITFTPPYNPKSNPVERSHRDLKSALLALSSHTPSKWDTYIPSILYALRCSVNRSTGFSPFQLMFGREPIDDLDTIFAHPTMDTDLMNAPEYFQQLKQQMHQAFEITRTNMGLAIQRQKRSYYRQKVEYFLNDLVWLFTPVLGQRQVTKMNTGWSGPWKISKKINDVTYQISPTSGLNHTRRETVSIDRIRKYFKDETELVIPPDKNVDLSNEGDFSLEDIPGLFIPTSSSIPKSKFNPSYSSSSPSPSTSPPQVNQTVNPSPQPSQKLPITPSSVLNPSNSSPPKSPKHQSTPRSTNNDKHSETSDWDTTKSYHSNLAWDFPNDMANWSNDPDKSFTSPHIGDVQDSSTFNETSRYGTPCAATKLVFDVSGGEDDEKEHELLDHSSPQRTNSPVAMSASNIRTAREISQADRRARYERRTGEPRPSTPEGMQSTRPNPQE